MRITMANPRPAEAMRRRGLGLAACFCLFSLWIAGVAMAQEPDHQSVNFTLYYPVGTNKDPDVSTNLRFSLLYGRVGEVRGFDLNTGVSIIQRDLSGFQTTLLYSQLGGSFEGLALTGLVNFFHSDAQGVQFAGLVNLNRGSMKGLQYATLFNFTQQGLKGVQLANVFNVNSGEGGFLQLSGVANSNDGGFRGAQIAAFNLATSRLEGFQLGLANMAGELGGAQLGLINLVRQSSGIQVGALNMAHENHGTSVGFVNLDETGGDVAWNLSASNLTAIRTGVRTEVNRWYSVLSVGYGDLQGDVEETVILGWNYGRSFELGGPWGLGVDLGYLHFIPEAQSDPSLNDQLHFAVQLRAILELRLTHQFAVFAGGGVSSIYSSYSSDAQQETEPHVVLGLSLF